MTLHQLGRQLREQVLNDHLQGRTFDPRRLQAVIGDLCGETHNDLVAPLRYLVLSAAFASASAQTPPLSDARLLQRLSDELAQMYAPPLCQRLQPLLEGLLGMPQRRPAAAAEAEPPPPASAAAASHPGPPQPRPSASGSTAMNVVLAFLSGLLLMLLGGIALVLWQRQQSPLVSSAPASAAASSEPNPLPGSPDVERAPSSTPSTMPLQETDSTASLDRAVGGIQALYSALSAKDFDQARVRYGAGVADQFDEAFFRQFERVSVQDLRSTSQTGNTVNLEGLVTFVWPDGTTQTETRTFSVNTGGDPPVITASEFGRVVKPR